MLRDLILKNRSYRRFDTSVRQTREQLLPLIEAARCSSSAGNLQRVRYAVITECERCDALFCHLSFAAYLKDWKGPSPDERPTAYLLLLTEQSPDATLGIDLGIAAEAILLSAVEQGLGGCMIRSFDHAAADGIVGREGWHVELVIALGVPRERVVLSEVKEGDIRYYRTEDGTHVVPKRSLQELLL